MDGLQLAERGTQHLHLNINKGIIKGTDMAKNTKKVVKKVIKKVLDSTELDEKLVAQYNKAEASGLIDKIKCYTKCYGGYILAIGAGCTFGASLLWGTLLLAGAAGWAYEVRRCKPCCNGGVCEPKEDCCK